MYRLVMAMVAALLSGAALSWFTHTPGTHLDSSSAGDSALISRVDDMVGNEGLGFDVLSVAEIKDGEAKFATLGRSESVEDQRFELGSITKLFTGMLLADAVERGMVELDDALADHLPQLDGTEVGEATLEQLATHTSGLSGIPSSDALGVSVAAIGNEDPYREVDRSEIVAAAATEERGSIGERVYSNFGVALLGHALAQASGAQSWEQLVTDRLLKPMGMNDTVFVPDSPENIEVDPRLSSGWPTPVWSGIGYAPAGSSTRTTTQDMARFAAAVLEGTAPGMSSLDPLTKDSDAHHSGMNWILGFGDHDDIAWHNGGTGGTSSMLAIDRDTGRAAIVLGNTQRSVDWIAVGLLRDTAPEAPQVSVAALVALLLGLLGVVGVVRNTLRGAARVPQITSTIDAGAFLAISFMRGPWDVLPGWLWGAMAGVGIIAAAVGLARIGDAPHPDKPLRHAGGIIGSLLTVAIAVYLA